MKGLITVLTKSHDPPSSLLAGFPCLGSCRVVEGFRVFKCRRLRAGRVRCLRLGVLGFKGLQTFMSRFRASGLRALGVNGILGFGIQVQ